VTPAQQERLATLLAGERVMSLGVVVDGEPVCGLLPYAIDTEGVAFLVHVSTLARHTRGLADGGRFAAIVHRPDDGGADPLQIERVSLQGAVRHLERGSPAHERGRAAYLRRFPHAGMTFGLGDFTLMRLQPESGRLVTGFAGALNLDERNLQSIADALRAATASSSLLGDDSLP